MIKHSKPLFGKEEKISALKVIDSGELSHGKIVEEFESLLAKKIGAKKSAAASSGTAALHLALVSMEIGEGDEVILPSWVCSAPLNAVLYCKAKPVLADIDSDYNISIDSVKKNLSEKTKAIIVPHMFGLPAELDELKKFGIPIIEDCAHSIGAEYKKKPVGCQCDLSVFSFYSTKMISAGEGGAVSGKRADLVEKCADLRDYTHKADSKLRFNYKWTNLQAAIALEQLKKLEKFLKARKEIAEKYFKELPSLGLDLPKVYSNRKHAFYRFMLRTRDSRKFANLMNQHGIGCGYGVLNPLHRILSLPEKDFVESEKAANESVSIPIYPALKKFEQEKVIDAVKSVLKKFK